MRISDRLAYVVIRRLQKVVSFSRNSDIYSHITVQYNVYFIPRVRTNISFQLMIWAFCSGTIYYLKSSYMFQSTNSKRILNIFIVRLPMNTLGYGTLCTLQVSM